MEGKEPGSGSGDAERAWLVGKGCERESTEPKVLPPIFLVPVQEAGELNQRPRH